MILYEWFLQPFADYGFMRRALVACVALSMSGAPLGVFLVLRRMSLMGDAMSHAILPGVSLAFLFYGVALLPMALGGLAAGLLVALVAGAVTHATSLKEDASFTGAYLISLALGVLIISVKGNSIDLLHVLFGNVLAVDNDALTMVAAIAGASLFLLSIIYRGLVIECFDAGFLQVARGGGAFYHHVFLMLMALNLVAAFQALGTLMALGLMILPAIAARFWTESLDRMVLLSMALAVAAAVAGLLISYHAGAPSGPSIVLTAGAIYIGSLLLGSHGSLRARWFPPRHFAE